MLVENQYRIENGTEPRMVRLTMLGILDGEIIRMIMSDFRREAQRLETLGCRAGGLRTLVDLREMEIQTKEVAAQLEKSSLPTITSQNASRFWFRNPPYTASR